MTTVESSDLEYLRAWVASAQYEGLEPRLCDILTKITEGCFVQISDGLYTKGGRTYRLATTAERGAVESRTFVSMLDSSITTVVPA
jgi:hypothetical protein